MDLNEIKLFQNIFNSQDPEAELTNVINGIDHPDSSTPTISDSVKQQLKQLESAISPAKAKQMLKIQGDSVLVDAQVKNLRNTFLLNVGKTLGELSGQSYSANNIANVLLGDHPSATLVQIKKGAYTWIEQHKNDFKNIDTNNIATIQQAVSNAQHEIDRVVGKYNDKSNKQDIVNAIGTTLEKLMDTTNKKMQPKPSNQQVAAKIQQLFEHNKPNTDNTNLQQITDNFITAFNQYADGIIYDSVDSQKQLNKVLKGNYLEQRLEHVVDNKTKSALLKARTAQNTYAGAFNQIRDRLLQAGYEIQARMNGNGRADIAFYRATERNKFFDQGKFNWDKARKFSLGIDNGSGVIQNAAGQTMTNLLSTKIDKSGAQYITSLSEEAVSAMAQILNSNYAQNALRAGGDDADNLARYLQKIERDYVSGNIATNPFKRFDADSTDMLKATQGAKGKVSSGIISVDKTLSWIKKKYRLIDNKHNETRVDNDLLAMIQMLDNPALFKEYVLSNSDFNYITKQVGFDVDILSKLQQINRLGIHLDSLKETAFSSGLLGTRGANEFGPMADLTHGSVRALLQGRSVIGANVRHGTQNNSTRAAQALVETGLEYGSPAGLNKMRTTFFATEQEIAEAWKKLQLPGMAPSVTWDSLITRGQEMKTMNASKIMGQVDVTDKTLNDGTSLIAAIQRLRTMEQKDDSGSSIYGVAGSGNSKEYNQLRKKILQALGYDAQGLFDKKNVHRESYEIGELTSDGLVDIIFKKAAKNGDKIGTNAGTRATMETIQDNAMNQLLTQILKSRGMSEDEIKQYDVNRISAIQKKSALDQRYLGGHMQARLQYVLQMLQQQQGDQFNLDEVIAKLNSKLTVGNYFANHNGLVGTNFDLKAKLYDLDSNEASKALNQVIANIEQLAIDAGIGALQFDTDNGSWIMPKDYAIAQTMNLLDIDDYTKAVGGNTAHNPYKVSPREIDALRRNIGIYRSSTHQDTNDIEKALLAHFGVQPINEQQYREAKTDIVNALAASTHSGNTDKNGRVINDPGEYAVRIGRITANMSEAEKARTIDINDLINAMVWENGSIPGYSWAEGAFARIQAKRAELAKQLPGGSIDNIKTFIDVADLTGGQGFALSSTFDNSTYTTLAGDKLFLPILDKLMTTRDDGSVMPPDFYNSFISMLRVLAGAENIGLPDIDNSQQDKVNEAIGLFWKDLINDVYDKSGQHWQQGHVRSIGHAAVSSQNQVNAYDTLHTDNEALRDVMQTAIQMSESDVRTMLSFRGRSTKGLSTEEKKQAKQEWDAYYNDLLATYTDLVGQQYVTTDRNGKVKHLKQQVAELKQGIIDAITLGSDTITSDDAGMYKGLLGEHHRYPSTNGLDMRLARIFVNKELQAGIIKTGLGLARAENADADGDKVYTALTSFLSSDLDASADRTIDASQQRLVKQRAMELVQRRISSAVAAVTIPEELAGQASDMLFDDSAINGTTSQKADIIAAAAAKMNKSATGVFSNIATGLRNIMKDRGWDETNLTTDGSLESEMRAAQSLLLRGLFESIEQDAISSKKVEKRILNQAHGATNEAKTANILSEIEALTDLLYDSDQTQQMETMQFVIERLQQMGILGSGADGDSMLSSRVSAQIKAAISQFANAEEIFKKLGLGEVLQFDKQGRIQLPSGGVDASSASNIAFIAKDTILSAANNVNTGVTGNKNKALTEATYRKHGVGRGVGQDAARVAYQIDAIVKNDNDVGNIQLSNDYTKATDATTAAIQKQLTARQQLNRAIRQDIALEVRKTGVAVREGESFAGLTGQIVNTTEATDALNDANNKFSALNIGKLGSGIGVKRWISGALPNPYNVDSTGFMAKRDEFIKQFTSGQLDAKDLTLNKMAERFGFTDSIDEYLSAVTGVGFSTAVGTYVHNLNEIAFKGLTDDEQVKARDKAAEQLANELKIFGVYGTQDVKDVIAAGQAMSERQRQAVQDVIGTDGKILTPEIALHGQIGDTSLNGVADILGIDTNEQALKVVDYKTTGKVGPEEILQVLVYKRMLDEARTQIKNQGVNLTDDEALNDILRNVGLEGKVSPETLRAIAQSRYTTAHLVHTDHAGLTHTYNVVDNGQYLDRLLLQMERGEALSVADQQLVSGWLQEINPPGEDSSVYATTPKGRKRKKPLANIFEGNKDKVFKTDRQAALDRYNEALRERDIAAGELQYLSAHGYSAGDAIYDAIRDKYTEYDAVLGAAGSISKDYLSKHENDKSTWTRRRIAAESNYAPNQKEIEAEAARRAESSIKAEDAYSAKVVSAYKSMYTDNKASDNTISAYEARLRGVVEGSDEAKEINERIQALRAVQRFKASQFEFSDKSDGIRDYSKATIVTGYEQDENGELKTDTNGNYVPIKRTVHFSAEQQAELKKIDSRYRPIQPTSSDMVSTRDEPKQMAAEDLQAQVHILEQYVAQEKQLFEIEQKIADLRAQRKGVSSQSKEYRALSEEIAKYQALLDAIKAVNEKSGVTVTSDKAVSNGAPREVTYYDETTGEYKVFKTTEDQWDKVTKDVDANKAATRAKGSKRRVAKAKQSITEQIHNQLQMVQIEEDLAAEEAKLSKFGITADNGKYNTTDVLETDKAAVEQIIQHIRDLKQLQELLQKMPHLKDTDKLSGLSDEDKALYLKREADIKSKGAKARESIETNFTTPSQKQQQKDAQDANKRQILMNRWFATEKKIVAQEQARSRLEADMQHMTAGSTEYTNAQARLQIIEQTIAALRSQNAVYDENTGALTLRDGTIVKLNATEQEQMQTEQQLLSLERQRIAQGKSTASQPSLLEQMVGTFKSQVRYMTTMNLVYKLINLVTSAIKNTINTIKTLDKSLVNLQIASGKSHQEMLNATKEYNAIAQDMGRTASDVLAAANDWLRAGYDINEANILIRNSMQLSTLGMMESAKATEALISVQKGWKLSVSEVSDVVDELTALDMKAAISAGDLATAMSKANATAMLAGSSRQNYEAYLTTVADISQAAPEAVGTAFKTIFARYGNVAAGKFDAQYNADADSTEDLQALNDTEKVLNKVGIQIRSSMGTFKNVDTVFEAIAQKWGTFDNVTQSAIATALGGTRQREYLTELFANWDAVRRYQKVANNAQGTADAKMTNYTDSIEAATNRFQASIEQWATSSWGKSIAAMLPKIVDLGTLLIKNLTPLLLLVSPALIRSAVANRGSLLSGAGQLLNLPGKIWSPWVNGAVQARQNRRDQLIGVTREERSALDNMQWKQQLRAQAVANVTGRWMSNNGPLFGTQNNASLLSAADASKLSLWANGLSEQQIQSLTNNKILENLADLKTDIGVSNITKGNNGLYSIKAGDNSVDVTIDQLEALGFRVSNKKGKTTYSGQTLTQAQLQQRAALFNTPEWQGADKQKKWTSELKSAGAAAGSFAGTIGTGMIASNISKYTDNTTLQTVATGAAGLTSTVGSALLQTGTKTGMIVGGILELVTLAGGILTKFDILPPSLSQIIKIGQEASVKLDKYAQAIQEATDKRDTLLDEQARLATLSRGIDAEGNNIALNANEWEEYQSIIKDLVDASNDLYLTTNKQNTTVVKSVNGFVNLNEAMQKAIDQQNKEIATQAKRYVANPALIAQSARGKAAEAYENAKNRGSLDDKTAFLQAMGLDKFAWYFTISGPQDIQNIVGKETWKNPDRLQRYEKDYVITLDGNRLWTEKTGAVHPYIKVNDDYFSVSPAVSIKFAQASKNLEEYYNRMSQLGYDTETMAQIAAKTGKVVMSLDNTDIVGDDQIDYIKDALDMVESLKVNINAQLEEANIAYQDSMSEALRYAYMAVDGWEDLPETFVAWFEALADSVNFDFFEKDENGKWLLDEKGERQKIKDSMATAQSTAITTFGKWFTEWAKDPKNYMAVSTLSSYNAGSANGTERTLFEETLETNMLPALIDQYNEAEDDEKEAFKQIINGLLAKWEYGKIGDDGKFTPVTFDEITSDENGTRSIKKGKLAQYSQWSQRLTRLSKDKNVGSLFFTDGELNTEIGLTLDELGMIERYKNDIDTSSIKSLLELKNAVQAIAMSRNARLSDYWSVFQANADSGISTSAQGIENLWKYITDPNNFEKLDKDDNWQKLVKGAQQFGLDIEKNNADLREFINNLDTIGKLDTFGNLHESLSQVQEKYSTIDSVLSDFATDGQLSMENMEKILAEFPDLINKLSDSADATEFQKALEDKVIQKTETMQRSIQGTLVESTGYWDNYLLDFVERYKDAAFDREAVKKFFSGFKSLGDIQDLMNGYIQEGENGVWQTVDKYGIGWWDTDKQWTPNGNTIDWNPSGESYTRSLGEYLTGKAYDADGFTEAFINALKERYSQQNGGKTFDDGQYSGDKNKVLSALLKSTGLDVTSASESILEVSLATQEANLTAAMLAYKTESQQWLDLITAAINKIDDAYKRGTLSGADYIKQLGQVATVAKKRLGATSKEYKELLEKIEETQLALADSGFEDGMISAEEYREKIASIMHDNAQDTDDYRQARDKYLQSFETEAQRTQNTVDMLEESDYTRKRELLSNMLNNYEAELAALTAAGLAQSDKYYTVQKNALEAYDKLYKNNLAEYDAAIAELNSSLELMWEHDYLNKERVLQDELLKQQEKMQYMRSQGEATQEEYNKALQEEYELQKKILENEKEKFQYAVDQNKEDIDSFGSLMQYEIDLLNKRKEAIDDYYNDEISKLEEANDQRKRSIEYEEKLQALENAKKDKVRVYQAGIGFTYQQNRLAVRKAQEDLDDYLQQRQITDLKAAQETENKYLNEIAHDWEDMQKLIEWNGKLVSAVDAIKKLLYVGLLPAEATDVDSAIEYIAGMMGRDNNGKVTTANGTLGSLLTSYASNNEMLSNYLAGYDNALQRLANAYNDEDNYSVRNTLSMILGAVSSLPSTLYNAQLAPGKSTLEDLGLTKDKIQDWDRIIQDIQNNILAIKNQIAGTHGPDVGDTGNDTNIPVFSPSDSFTLDGVTYHVDNNNRNVAYAEGDGMYWDGHKMVIDEHAPHIPYRPIFKNNDFNKQITARQSQTAYEYGAIMEIEGVYWTYLPDLKTWVVFNSSQIDESGKYHVDAGDTTYSMSLKAGKPVSFYSSGIEQGPVTYTGLAMLHGTPSNPEYVLNSDQAGTLLKNLATISMQPYRAPQVSNNTDKNQQANYFNFDKLVLPNVETPEQFMKELLHITKNQFTTRQASLT